MGTISCVVSFPCAHWRSHLRGLLPLTLRLLSLADVDARSSRWLTGCSSSMFSDPLRVRRPRAPHRLTDHGCVRARASRSGTRHQAYRVLDLSGHAICASEVSQQGRQSLRYFRFRCVKPAFEMLSPHVGCAPIYATNLICDEHRHPLRF